MPQNNQFDLDAFDRALARLDADIDEMLECLKSGCTEQKHVCLQDHAVGT